MIRFGGKKDGRLFMGIGLSRENTNRLMLGQPIVFEMDEIGGTSPPFSGTLLIVFYRFICNRWFRFKRFQRL